MQLTEGKDTARTLVYRKGMPQRSYAPDDDLPVFAVNLQRLMDVAKLNQTELHRLTGVSQRHISALVRGESDCTLQVAEQIAKPFGLRGWHLMLPNLPADLVNSPRVLALVESYLDANEEGRTLLDAHASAKLCPRR